MKFKKIAAVALGAVMVTAGVAMASACNKDDKDGYKITVWVGEKTKTLTEKLIKKFNEENPQGIKFNAKVNEVTESRAAGDVIAKPADAPEIFCFAQDQIARLVSTKLLAQPAAGIVSNIKATHTATAVSAATVGNTVYAYPLTEDNGYFLYYDKSVISEEAAATIEGIVSACESSKKYFCFNLSEEGAGWYISSFFNAVGAKSEWATDDNGTFTGYDDTYNSDEGVIALKGVQKVVKSSRYLASDKASNFTAATPAAAVVSGVWDYETAKSALGNNLGVAKLPSFKVDGVDYQLNSSLGCKLLGVSPQQDSTKAAALMLLAQYLTNASSQMARFDALGWGPSVQASTASSDVLTALKQSATKNDAIVSQGQYPANWWAKAQVLGLRAKDAAGDGALRTALNTYEEELVSLKG